MIKIFIALTLTILVSVVSAETKIYKHIDENGKVHYSDKKPTPDAKEADLPKLTIFESKKYQKNQEDGINSRVKRAKPEDPGPGLLENFKINSPLSDETIINTAGKVKAGVQINGELPEHIEIRFYLNNNLKQTSQLSSAELTNVFRGEHEVYAKAFNTTLNKVIKTTPKVKFYVRQSVKKR